MRRVLDDPAPGQVQQPLRPHVAVQREQGFGDPFEQALHPARRLAYLDAVRGDAHEHVGPGSRAQLAGPGAFGEGPRARRRDVLGQRRDAQLVAVLLAVEGGYVPGIARQRQGVILAVHGQDLVVTEGRQLGPDVHVELVRYAVRQRQKVPAVAIAAEQVFAADGGAVRRRPRENVAVDGGRDAAPDDGILDARPTQELRHLGHVAEHVGQVADLHHPAQLRRPPHPLFEVPDERLAGDEELVHQDPPGTDGKPPCRDEARDALLVLRPDLEVVVHGRRLAVEREAHPRVGLHLVEQAIDQLDQAQAERLEREVPLAVPVRVRDQVDDAGRRTLHRSRSAASPACRAAERRWTVTRPDGHDTTDHLRELSSRRGHPRGIRSGLEATVTS